VLGSLSFGLSFIIIAAHYWRLLTNCFLSGGGCTAIRRAPLYELLNLGFLAIWWIVGVGLLTQAGGIAYSSLNVYYATWLTLCVTLIALNNWFVIKGKLSVRDFLNQSPTLSAWYSLMLVSTIEFGSAANIYDVNFDLIQASGSSGDWIFAIVAGSISFFFCAVVILAHYQIRCFRWLAPGGLLELFICLILLTLWIVAVAILTRQNGIAANFSGGGNSIGINATANVYYSVWMAFFNSVYLLSKWQRKNEGADRQRQASAHNIDDGITDDL
jgi:hypothetical protein